MAKSLIGIDLGTNNIKMVTRDGSGVHGVLARLPEDMVDLEGRVTAPDTLAEALKQAKSEYHIHQKHCALVLSPEQCFFRHATLPAMTVDELKLNLPYEFRDYIDDDPTAYVYDYAVDELVCNEAGIPERLELYAAAVRRSVVEDMSAVLRKAGFKLQAVIPPQMALSRLIKDHVRRVPADEQRDVIFVDLGGASVVASLYHGDDFQAMRTIDFGCREFDRAIAELRNIDRFTAASYIASNFEGVLDTPEAQAVCERICVEVNKVVNFYNFSNRDKDIDRMYLMGGGSQIPQLVRALVEAVDMEVLPSSALVDQSVARSIESQHMLSYACMLEGEAM
jgi:type IV pilus assembly protein PilM